ncbi:conserved hypothetical protein [Lactococcus garvieae ATCC 49156]|uniref:Uncharacterized protein n=1 Tax=Lactococcus garvieae (strain Lg2) TaxID=420890 RepID=F9VE05_LACGL|nr:conserved hypothetical protein [Lactococcus garvieae ATCC 49156]BAK60556.1 conserved hypothetical protein [Lactococcus garvieae Lg2]
MPLSSYLYRHKNAGLYCLKSSNLLLLIFFLFDRIKEWLKFYLPQLLK